jgi:hypothetical protein
MSSFYETEKTAQKPHLCLWCKQRIEPGSRYVLNEYAEGSYHWRNHFHVECSAAAHRLSHEEMDWWNDEGCVPDYVRGETVLQEHATMRTTTDTIITGLS